MSLNNECQYCSRKYKIKKNFMNHLISCELIHKIQSVDEFQDSIETIPSQREIFQFIKKLALKCSVLEKEVIQLKKNTGIRQKREILEILNEKKMNESFTTWYKEIDISEDDMKIAMEHNLTKAIIHLIKKKLEVPTNDINLPFACFKEKPNIIFLYDVFTSNSIQQLQEINSPFNICESFSKTKFYNNESQKEKPIWKLASNDDIEKMVKYLSHEILKVFVKWQKENIEFFMANEQNKNLEIEYMSRISGHKNPLEKRTTEFKKWLYCFIQQ